jgi:hypothetical protein
MKSATLDQARKLLDVFADVPTNQMQEILESGALADVRDANFSVFNREDHRKHLGLTPLELKIIVDYGMTLEQMIAAGGYDWVNDNITAKRFPLSGKGRHEMVAELIPFNRGISSEEAVVELDKMGFRPGTVEELLAFGAAFPETQRKFPILALGSPCGVGGDRLVAYLRGHDARRRLDLLWWDSRWIDYCRFLAVRK